MNYSSIALTHSRVSSYRTVRVIDIFAVFFTFVCEFNIIANDASTNCFKTACPLCFTLYFLSFSSISTVVILLVSAQLDFIDPFMAQNNYLNFNDDGIIS